ncbi:hypothetical protein DKP78_20975, partial [Enterococcus faecium]
GVPLSNNIKSFIFSQNGVSIIIIKNVAKPVFDLIIIVNNYQWQVIGSLMWVVGVTDSDVRPK